MSYNALIQTERPPISTMVNGLRTGTLFVDDTFQRKLVWTEKQKVRLVETILMGYPMPEIYLWQQPANAESGEQTKSIVDGQQRLTTMRQFVANEWPLKVSYLDTANKSSDFAGKFWKDLDDSIKQSFWDYVLNIRIIPNSIGLESIIGIFKRLNETDKSLNPQEIRNAEFNGKMITAAEELTKHDFWQDYDVFSPAQIRRMTDIEFASSLLIFLRRGSVQENNKLINEMYDLYNDKYRERSEDINYIKKYLDWLKNLNENNENVRDMFSKTVHIFTLFTTQKTLQERNGNVDFLPQRKLLNFVREYENAESSDSNVLKYRLSAQARTRSKSSRENRMNSLISFLNENQ